jgi:hypothetical protein
VISDQPESPGPSHSTLANLAAMMPSFIKGLNKKKIVGKGIPSLIRRPQKVCQVCGLLWDHAMLKATDDVHIKTQLCDSCQNMMASGCSALVCGDEYAFVKSYGLEDWAGTIKQVSAHVMASVKKTHHEVKERSKDAPEPPE